MSNDTNDHEANGIASNGNHETSPDLNGHFDQRQVANKDNKEPRVEPLVLKRSVLQQKQRWSCKEELSFYRTLVSIGIQKSADDDRNVATSSSSKSAKKSSRRDNRTIEFAPPLLIPIQKKKKSK